MNARSQQEFFGQIGGDQLIRLFDLLPDVNFFIKDHEARFVALNQKGCDYCGVKSEREALGKCDHDFFTKRRADEYQRDDLEVIRSGKPIVNRIESAPEYEGSPRLVMTSKIPLHNQQGQVIGLAGVSREVEQVRERPHAAEKFSQIMRRIHLHPHETLATSELAASVGLSVSQFDRVFRKAFGTSLRQYVLRVRVEAACRHLAQTDETIAAIAQECGFFDHAHFARCFRQIMGITPSDYRQQQRMPKPR